MPKISEEIILNRPINEVFNEIPSIEFMKKIDPNSFKNIEIKFQNERLLRFVSKGTPSGDIEIERICIPENYTIITKRLVPLAPFIYQISFKFLIQHSKETLLKTVNEFELDENNKSKEGMLVSIIRKNDILNLQNTKNYFDNKK